MRKMAYFTAINFPKLSLDRPRSRNKNRFKNYWILLPGFLEKVKTIWEIDCPGDSAKKLSAKFKLLRKGLKTWSNTFAVLDNVIANCNKIILRLDSMEEQRVVHITEWNFCNIVKDKLQFLLLCKQDYWKKRCTARWARLGDENTSFFHSMATIRYRKNLISSLTREDGSLVVDHDEKAGLLWNSFRSRRGCQYLLIRSLSSLTSLPDMKVWECFLNLSLMMKLTK
jgi:hypothetical protein